MTRRWPRTSWSRILVLKQSQVDAEQLKVPRRDRDAAARHLRGIDQGALAVQAGGCRPGARPVMMLQRQQRDELRFRAGLAGCCRSCPSKSDSRSLRAQPGTRREPGSSQSGRSRLPRHRQGHPDRSARAIDTRTASRRTREPGIDPSVQNGTRTSMSRLPDTLPKAPSRLSVDGQSSSSG